MPSDPTSTAGLYPLLGLLHIVTHPKTLAAPLSTLTSGSSPVQSSTLLLTILKTLLLTSTLTGALIFTLFRLTDRIILVLARSVSLGPIPVHILATNGWLRGAVALAAVAVQGALIAGRVVEYAVGEGARRVGRGVLAGEIGSGEMLKDPSSGAGAGKQEILQNLQNPKAVGRKMGDKVQREGVSWVLKKAISIPVAMVPVIGPVVYAVFNAADLGRQYIGPYAKQGGVEGEVDNNPRSVKAFGLVAGFFQALPIVGPIFFFSNYVGSALFVADMKKFKQKQK